MRNLEKVHLLVYDLNEEKYMGPESPRLSTILPSHMYSDLIFSNSISEKEFIILGWCLLKETDEHVRVHMFEIFLQGPVFALEQTLNFGDLMYYKILELTNKYVYICDPIPKSFKYWIKIGLVDDMFESWCSEYNASREECSDMSNERFKEFLKDQLQWDEASIERYNRYNRYIQDDENSTSDEDLNEYELLNMMKNFKVSADRTISDFI